MVSFIDFPALRFPSLHIKGRISNVFSFQFVSVSPWLFTVTRVRRWTRSFCMRRMFSCMDCLHVGLSGVPKSAIRIWPTEYTICQYTPCAKAVNVVYSSLISELWDLVVFVGLLLFIFLSSYCPYILSWFRPFLLRWLPLFINIFFLPFSILISFSFFPLRIVFHAHDHDVTSLL